MRGLALALGLWAALATAPAAWGHAALVRSEPADRAVVAESPPVVTLTAESGATRTPIPAQGGQQSGDCGQQVKAA